MLVEEWRDVIGWEEFYEISSIGRVKCKQRVMYYDRNLGRGIEKKTVYEKIRKQKLNKHTGYMVVGLNGKGLSTNVTIHSMVARAFIKNYISKGRGKGSCTNHKDGNKLNNSVENLEVISFGDNIRHAFTTGLSSSHPVTYKGVYYYSKTEMRRVVGVGESRQKKMLEE